jgi:putative tricarboxylic transport membrane protein
MTKSNKFMKPGLMIALGSATAALMLAPGAHAQEAWSPQKPVEIVVGSAPGGGNDKTARTIQKIWTDKKLVESVVVNKVGGGGAISYGYVSQKKDPHFVGVAQASLITNHISGRSELQLSDVTPLAYIGSEPVAIAVKADSPYKNMKDFLEQLKKDPSSLSISVGSTRGSTNHIGVALAAKAHGIDPKKLKIVVFGGGAESVTNLLGGHIDAMAGLINNAIPHHQAGTMRILCVTSTQRAKSVPDAPTCKEQGFDAVAENWTVVIGPKSLTPEQKTKWEAILKETADQEEWKKYLADNSWTEDYKNAQDTKEFLDQDYKATKDMLVDFGLAKQ